MAWLERSTLLGMGFAAVGDDVLISERASLYNISAITLGNHVRIDDFCILSAGQGGIVIGNHVHVSAYSSLVGRARITLSDFAGLSSRVCIFSSSDDYSGATLTNPTVPEAFTGVTHAEVFLGRHVIVGAGCVILPGVRLEDGVAVASLCLVNRSCEAFGFYAGTPVRRVKDRSRELLALEQKLQSSRMPSS